MSFGVGDDNAILQRVLHSRQSNCRSCLVFAMILNCLGEVDISDDVGCNDQERLLQAGSRKANSSGGSKVLLTDDILDLYTEIAAVTEVAAYGIGLVIQDDNKIIEPMLFEQSYDVQHHGTVGEWNHRFWKIDRQWA